MTLKAYDTAPTHLELGKLIKPYERSNLYWYSYWYLLSEEREEGKGGEKINNKSQAKWP